MANLLYEKRPLLGARSSLLDGLRGYWKLGEASGVALDSGPNNLTLTDNNTVTAATGKVVGARQFTRANSEYFSLTDPAVLSFPDSPFTLCAWVYRDSTPVDRMQIVGKGANLAGANGYEWALHYNGAVPAVRLNVSNGTVEGLVNGGTFATGEWHFLVAWHNPDADTINLQVDGGAVNSTAYSSGSYDGTGDFLIGGAGSDLWDGRIDEVGVWSRVLSASERAALYNGGAGLTHPFS